MATAKRHFRFATENCLGRLAKWLRILGFDTLYDRHDRYGGIAPAELGDRIWLTRNTTCPRPPPPTTILFIHTNEPMQQVQQVVTDLGLRRPDLNPFTLCITCNRRLAIITKDEVRGRVPDYVWDTQKTFHRCRQCARIFWPGSHTNRIQQQIRTLLGASPSNHSDTENTI